MVAFGCWGGIMGLIPRSGLRVAGFVEIGFVVLFIVVVVLGFDSPSFDDPAADVRGFLVDSDPQVHLVTWLGAVFFSFRSRGACWLRPMELTSRCGGGCGTPGPC